MTCYSPYISKNTNAYVWDIKYTLHSLILVNNELKFNGKD